MDYFVSGNLSYLDMIRNRYGKERLTAHFTDICRRNKRHGINLLNHRLLTFPCLFILLPQVKAFDLYHRLSDRNTFAADFTDKILNLKAFSGRSDLSAKNAGNQSALRWMLATGAAEDSLGEDFEKVLDIVVSVLINQYEDREALAITETVIFNRLKKGRNIHDLVWAFFRYRHPITLKLIARHLLSSDPKEVWLACSLLHLEPPESNNETGKKLYEHFNKWLEDNDPFLYFTGESLQYSSEPVMCRVDLERKYLHRANLSYTRQPVSADEEGPFLEAFSRLSDEDKELLSEHSNKVYKRSADEWERWIKSPVDEQLKSAKTESEEQI